MELSRIQAEFNGISLTFRETPRLSMEIMLKSPERVQYTEIQQTEILVALLGALRARESVAPVHSQPHLVTYHKTARS